jgi:hypothetical protein
VTTRYNLWNLVALHDLGALREELGRGGYALREFSTTQAADPQGLFDEISPQLGFRTPHNWSAFSDLLPNALLPDDDEGDRVAVLWAHADHLVQTSLGTFLTAVDVLVGLARQAYEQELHMILFLLGDGPNFPPLEP